jgi:SNF2 family DNA or RNA helicase
MTDKQAALYKEALNGDLYKKIAMKRYFDLKERLDESPNPTEKELEQLEFFSQKYEESMTKDGLYKNKIAALVLCQLVSNSPALVKEEGESSKELEFRRIFEQELSEDKVIVFTRFKTGLERLEKILDDLEQPHVRITGSETNAERDVARLTFQDVSKKVNVIFITTAGSAALNLQAANILLFYDTPWSYGDLYQTIGRAQRIGSIYEHIHIIHFINQKTIDEHVLEILGIKKDLIQNVMGDIAEGAIDFKDEIMFKDDDTTVNALYKSVFGS